MSSIIQQIAAVHHGLNYLVPLQWWEQFLNINKNVRSQSSFNFPPLNNKHLVQPFLLDFKDQIIQELQHKSNQLRFKKVFFNPQPKSNQKWKPISPALWKMIPLNNQSQIVITHISNSQKYEIFPTLQLQIVFCSKKISDLFVGFLPQNASVIQIIRQVGFEMGFIEMENSKIIFPDISAQKNYNYNQIQNLTIKSLPDTFIMAFNLQQQQQQTSLKKQVQIIMNASNEAVAGDLITMIDESRQREVNDGTLSTGAETPFSFFGSDGYDIDRQYRVNELFRDKKPQEVKAMKAYAKQAINSQLIKVPTNNLKIIQQELDKIAEQMLEALHIHKKKNKQKEANNSIYQL